MLLVRSRNYRSTPPASGSLTWARRVVSCSPIWSGRALMLLCRGSRRLRLHCQKRLQIRRHRLHHPQLTRNGSKNCHRKDSPQSS